MRYVAPTVCNMVYPEIVLLLSANVIITLYNMCLLLIAHLELTYQERVFTLKDFKANVYCSFSFKRVNLLCKIL